MKKERGWAPRRRHAPLWSSWVFALAAREDRRGDPMVLRRMVRQCGQLTMTDIVRKMRGARLDIEIDWNIKEKKKR